MYIGGTVTLVRSRGECIESKPKAGKHRAVHPPSPNASCRPLGFLLDGHIISTQLSLSTRGDGTVTLNSFAEMSAAWSVTWRIIGAGLRGPLQQITLSTTRTSFTTTVESTLIPALYSRSFCSETESSWSRLKLPSRLVDTLHTRRRPHISRISECLSSFRLPYLGHAVFSDQRKNSIVSRPNIRKLSSAEIQAIFGNSLNRKGGNKLLRTLQDQRVAGTLDEDNSACPDHISRGLIWLRNNYPVDEDGAIIARLEREEAEVERIGYEPQIGIGSGRYSQSIVEEIQKYHKEKAAQEKEEQDDGADYSGTKELAQTSVSRAVVTRKSNIPEWVMRHREAATGKDEVPPEMTNFQRLWPSTLFTVAFTGFSILFARNYDPPTREARLFPDIPPAAATVMALIGINVIVFAAWRIVPPALKILNKYFIWTPGLPVSSSLLGSLFSHQELRHLASNMLVLWVAGTKVHDEYGRGTFLAMFLSIGVLSSYFSLAISVSQKIFNTYHMGASAGICGLLAILCWTHAWNNVTLPFVPWEQVRNIPMISFLGLAVFVDIVGQIRHRSLARVNHMAHLSGYILGILVAENFRHN